MEKEEKIKEAKEFLEANGYTVYKGYSYLVDKWVVFRQKGMRPLLHGKVRKVDDSGLCTIRGKRAKIRFANVDKIIGIYDKKSDCYAVNEFMASVNERVIKGEI